MRFLLALALAILQGSLALADPGRLDPSFAPTQVPDGPVRDLMVLPDGDIIIAGEFTRVGTISQAYIAKYHPDGSFDPSFDPVLDGPVYTLELAGVSPSIYAGGAFTTVNGTPSKSLVVLTLAGLRTPSSPIGSGFDGPVYKIHNPHPNALGVVVGGDFDNYQGQPAGNLAEVSYTGNLQVNFEANGPVRDIAGWATDGLLVGGSFSRIGSATVSNLAVVNPFGGSGSVNGFPGPNGEVAEVASLAQPSPAPQLFAVGGSFTYLYGPTSGFTAVSNQPRTFNQFTQVVLTGDGAGAANATALCPDADGALLVGDALGNLWRFDALTQRGSREYGWATDADFPTGSRANGKIDVIIQEDSGRYYIAGEFTEVDGTARPSLARLHGPQGSTTPDPITGIETIITDDRALVEIEAIPYALDYEVQYRAHGAVRWRTNGSTATPRILLSGLQPGEAYDLRARARNINGLGPFGPDVPITTTAARSSGALAYVRVPHDKFSAWGLDLLTDASGRLGVIGDGNIDGNLVGEFVMVDEQLDVIFSFNNTNNPRVELAAPDPRGGIVVATSTGDIERLDADGNADPGFVAGENFSYKTLALAVQSDGKVLVGGYFTEAGGSSNDALVRLNANGTIDTAYDPVFLDGLGIGKVELLEVLPGDGLLVLGTFDAVDGVPAGEVVKLTAEGEVDPSFSLDPSTSNFWILNDATVDALGRVILAGVLQDNPSGGRNAVTRLLANGTIDPSWLGAVARSGTSVTQGRTITLQPDGKLLVGGSFDTVNGTVAHGLVRLDANGAIDSTFDAGLGPRYASGNVVGIDAIALRPDSTIAIAGQFTTCDGEPRTNFALLRGDTTPSDYELWLAAHGLPSGSSPSLDGDGDKRGLGIEFAYRLNPHARDTMAILDADAEGARIAPPQQRGVRVEGWFSESLGGWQPVPVGADWTMNGPGGTSGPTGFFRFELTPGP